MEGLCEEWLQQVIMRESAAESEIIKTVNVNCEGMLLSLSPPLILTLASLALGRE